ncbi:MAG: hypothetical protein PVF45_10585, partial [Anaerolineae bacterium]
GTLSLRVRAPGGTLALNVLTNTVSITTLPQDPNVDNNTARFVARNPDLGASFKQASPSQVTPGGLITYTVTLHNAGLVAVMGEMRDALPPELSFVPGSLTCASGTASTSSCGYASGTITWTGTVGPKASVPVQFQATAPHDAAHGLPITNTALITDLAWSLVYPLTTPVEVIKLADLWVKQNGSETAEAGEALVYTLTYGNAGPFDADSAAQVVDTLPAAVTYLKSAPPGMYDPAQGTVAWDVGALPASLSGTLDVAGTLILSVEVPADTPPLTVLTNTARISPIPQDPNTANNINQLPTVVNLFHLTKSVNPSEALPGEAVIYTLTLANGDDVTVTAHLTDRIPLGVAYVSSSSEVNAVKTELYDDASGSIRWQGDVPPYSTTTLRFQAQITATRGTAITNTVQVKHRQGIVSSRQVVVYSTPYRAYLPLMVKGD